MDLKLKESIDIATKELRDCYLDNGIIAGTHHFTDYWARDAYFAAFGSLSIGDNFIVKKTLANFYSYQRSDGLIPYRIMRGPANLKKYLGKPSFYSKPRPTYKLRGFGTEVLDGTTMTILFSALLELREHQDNIQLALKYLETREKDGLLYDGMMAEWNDTALKFGNLLYSNIIYWYMYDRLVSWVKTFDEDWSKRLEIKKTKIAQALRDKLWTGNYFADWHDYKRQDYFYPFGNLLAIAWGLTTDKEAESILKQCSLNKIQFTLETNTPKYPFWRIDLFQQLSGMGDYQNNGILWWQPVTTYLAALKRLGKQSEALEVEQLMTNKITSDKKIFECYERNGLPMKHFIFRSEYPFAWSSGMLLWSLLF